jgi:hypothetical protein
MIKLVIYVGCVMEEMEKGACEIYGEGVAACPKIWEFILLRGGYFPERDRIVKEILNFFDCWEGEKKEKCMVCDSQKHCEIARTIMTMLISSS